MKSQNVIEANSENHCQCCMRVHRKLYLIDGYWLGASCAEDYALYKSNDDIKSTYWIGYERKHAKVAHMVTSQSS